MFFRSFLRSLYLYAVLSTSFTLFAADVTSSVPSGNIGLGYPTIELYFDEDVSDNGGSITINKDGSFFETISASSFSCSGSVCSYTSGNYYYPGFYSLDVSGGAFVGVSSNPSSLYTAAFSVGIMSYSGYNPTGTVSGSVTFSLDFPGNIYTGSSTININQNSSYYTSISPSSFSCSSSNCNYNIGSLPDASYDVTFPVGSFIDSSSGYYSDALNYSFTVITPQVVLNSSSPSGTVSGSSVDIYFDWSEPVYATGIYNIEVLKDSSPYTTIYYYSVSGCSYSQNCSYSLGSLPDGNYEIQIPINTYVGTSTSQPNAYQSFSFTVITPHPTLSSFLPTGTISDTSGNFSFSWSENGSPVSVYPSYNSFDVYKDGTYFTSINTSSTGCYYSPDCSYSLGTISDGSYEIRMSDNMYYSANTGLGNAQQVVGFTVDTVAPTLSEVTPVPNPVNSTTPSYTFYASESGSVSYSGDCYSSSYTYASSGNTTIIFDSPLSEGYHSNCTLTVTDDAGNVSSALGISGFMVDTTPPNISEITPVSDPTNDATPDYIFSSDEAGTINYGGDCSSGTTSATAGNNTISFNSLGDGYHSNCTLTITDTAGNTSATLSVTPFSLDATAPSVIEITPIGVTALASPDYTFSSDEAGMITYGGDCSSTTTSASMGNNMITLDTLGAGTHTNCTIIVTDGVGNISNTLNISVFTIDTTSPTVTINQAVGQADPTSTSPINFTVVFSESVSDFVSGDVTLSGTAGATTAVVTGSGTTYNVAVSGMASSGTVIASLGAGVASDNAGNTSAASTSTDNSVTVDITRPTVSITLSDSALKIGETSTVTFTFSEAPTGFDVSDVTTIENGTLSVFAVIGNPLVYTATFTPTMNVSDAINVITVGTGWTDGVGNTPNGNTSSANYTIDTSAPVLAEVTAVPTPTNDTTPNYTFSSDEAGAITYGGDCSSTTTIAVAGNHTITFATLTAGIHTNCTIVVTDAAGNVSSALTVPAFTIDTSAPILASTTVNASTLTLVYSESLDPASVPVIGDFVLSVGHSVSSVTISGSTVTLMLTPAADNAETIILDYTLGSAPIRDIAGNTVNPIVARTLINTTPTPPVTSTGGGGSPATTVPVIPATSLILDSAPAQSPISLRQIRALRSQLIEVFKNVKKSHPPLDSAPTEPLDTDASQKSLCENTPKTVSFGQCSTGNNISDISSTVDYLACQGFIEKQPNIEDGYATPVPRKEIVDITVSMADIFYSERPPVTSLDTGFTDVSESWLQPVISRALSYNIISSSRRFQPDRYTTRLDAYTMIMNAVCMERPVLSAVQARPDLIYQTALDNGLTTRPSLRDFQPNGLISRQEMYIVIGRAAEWVEKTGGCQPIVNSCRKS